MASKTETIYASASNKYGYVLGTSFTETVVEDLKASNKTKVTTKASFSGKDINFSGGNNTLDIYWYDNNKNSSGKKVASKTITSTTRGVTYTAEGTIEVEHNSDGTLKGYAKAVWTKVGSSSYIPASTSLSTDETSLTTLPRESSIENKTGTIGTEMTISWIRASESFTHTLEIAFGEKTYTYSDLGVSTTWTPPTELYKYLTGSSGEGTLTLKTYNGTSQIGVSKTATLTLYPDKEATKPTLDEHTIKDINATTKALTGNEKTIVAHKSLVNVGLWIYTKEYAKAKKIIFNNTEITIPSGTTQSDGKTTLYLVEFDIGNIASDTFTLSVTDTRDITLTEEIKAQGFVQYVPLDISSSFKRIAPTTGEVGVEFSGNYFNGSFGSQSNSLSIGFKYKKKSEDTYSSLISLTNNTDYKIDGNTYHSGSGSSKTTIKLNAVFDYRYVYDVQFVVSDKATTLPTINVVIAKGIPIFWWNDKKVVVNGELYVADENGENLKLIGSGGDTLPIDAIFEYDGDVVPEGYEEVEEQKMWSYSLTTANPSLNTWAVIGAEKTTATLPAGTYIFVYKASLNATANGIGTLNPGLDGTRLSQNHRSTMPLGNGLNSTTQCIVPQTFTTTATHKVNLYIYTNANLATNAVDVDIIRIG